MNTLLLLASQAGPDVGRGGVPLPAALSRVGSYNLLARWQRHAATLGVDRVVYVVGAQAELVIDHAVSDPAGLNQKFVINRSWDNTGSAFNLARAASAVEGEVIIADVRLFISRRWVSSFCVTDSLAIGDEVSVMHPGAVRVEGRRILPSGARATSPTSSQHYAPHPLVSLSRSNWARLVALAEKSRARGRLQADWLDLLSMLIREGSMHLRPVASPQGAPVFFIDSEAALLNAERFCAQDPSRTYGSSQGSSLGGTDSDHEG